MAKYIKNPFGVNGDLVNVPDDTQVDGGISYNQGYPDPYQRNPATDPTAKRIERAKMNKLFNDVTSNIKEWQEQSFPDWISDDGSGTPFAYDKFAIVRYTDGNNYVSLVDNNTGAPTVVSNWQEFSLWINSFIDLSNYVEKKKDASGDVDAVLTGGIYAYSSSLTNLPVGAGSAGSLFVSQGIGTSARSQLLISSNGNMFFRYGDSSSWDNWEQPVKNSDFVQSLATEGYQKLPSGLILQWGVTTSGTSGTETFPIAFPNACFGVQITNDRTNNSSFVSTFSVTSFDWAISVTAINRYLAIGY